MAASATLDQTARSFLIPSARQEVLMEGPVGVVAKVWGEQTGGVISIVEHPVQPGVLVPPHTHQDLDEWSYILEGRIGARIGNEEFTAEPGDYVLKPRRIPHTFWNAGPGHARLIEIITPAGFEHFFARLGEQIRSSGFDPAAVAELGAQYGTSYEMEWVPDLEERYGIKLMGT